MERCPREDFVRNVYQYCGENIGERVLFPAFTILWPLAPKEEPDNPDFFITPKDLAVLTSEITICLERQKVLRKVNGDKFESHYPMYEILPHNRLSEAYESKR